MNHIPIPSFFEPQIPQIHIESTLHVDETKKDETKEQVWFHQCRPYPLFHLLYKKWGGSTHANEGVAYLRNEILQSLYAQQNYETSSQIEISTSRYWTNIYYSGLPDEFSDVLNQITKLSQLEIPKDLFETSKKLLIDEIKTDGDYPDVIIQRLFLYHNSPYTYMKYGRISVLQNITYSMLQDDWNRFRNSQRGVLFSTSTTTQKELLQKLNTQNIVPPIFRPPLQPNLNIKIQKKSIFVGNRDLEQSHILMVAEVLGMDSPYCYPLLVAVQLLGGSFDSRLSRILRIEQGLTYDISMYVQEGKASSLLFLQTAVEDIRMSLDIIKKTISTASKGWTDLEIKTGIDSMQYEYATSFVTGRRTINILEESYLLDGSIAPLVSPYQNIKIEDVRHVLQLISQYEWFSIVLGHPSDYKTIKNKHEFVKGQIVDYM